MFFTLMALVFTSYPIGFVLGGVAILFGLIGSLAGVFSLGEFFLFASRIWFIADNLQIIAVPLFVFMGVMLERAEIAKDLLETLQILLRRVPGGMAMAVTQICTAAAALSWLFAEWVVHGKPSVLGIVSGAVGGLVAITPAAGFVDPMGALIMGLIAGVACFWGATSLKRMCGYDDSLDVFGVHGIGGIVGALLTGVFAIEAIGGTPGLLEGNAVQVWKQFEGILATVAYSAVATPIILKVVDLIIGLRVDEETEIEGLDINLHGEVVQ